MEILLKKDDRCGRLITKLKCWECEKPPTHEIRWNDCKWDCFREGEIDYYCEEHYKEEMKKLKERMFIEVDY